ncbi:hypothetical protein N0V90_003765 [Kalmusia sp. IMI 367209]|nr:hypothetical protein N0V90_003765 [Kalmusia sp. IMI 367209]
MELDVIDSEPTVLEYARFHGLCRDYTQEHLVFDRIIPPSDEGFGSDLRDPQDAIVSTDNIDNLTKEPLAVSQEAAMLLKSVLFLQEAPPNLQTIPDGRKRILSLKQEVPILRTDNDLDMLEFSSVVEPSFAETKIPLEPVNEEDDEGLEWPSKYFKYPTQCDERAKSEKLTIPKEVLLYLQAAIKDFDLPEGSETTQEQRLNYRKNTAIRPLTPPLLPLTPPMTPYIPSSPGDRLELISEDSDSTAAEAKALEEKITSADALVRYDSNSSEIMQFDMIKTGKYEPSLDEVKSPSSKRKAADLKVEGPLTPVMFSESSAKKLKTVAFAEMLVEYMPANHTPELPSSYGRVNDILSPEDDYDTFQEVFEPYADDANWEVENEKLSEADTTKRVDVPKVDFRLPIAPWDEFARNVADINIHMTEVDAQARFLLWTKRNHMKSVITWHGISELERKLPLAPFSTQSVQTTIEQKLEEEKLHGTELVTKMLAEVTVGDIATCYSDMWKRDGLRVLENDEEEDVLETADLKDCKDIDSLIRKRKIELEAVVEDRQPLRRASIQEAATAHEHPDSRHEILESRHWRHALPVRRANIASRPVGAQSKKQTSIPVRSKIDEAPDRDKSLMFGGKFSATSALDNFMALHRLSVKPKEAAKEQAAPSRASMPSLISPIRPVVQSHNDTTATSKPGIQVRPEVARQPLDLPPLPEHTPPCSFIISSALLQQRNLSRQIERLYPDAVFVSRDFDSPNAVCKEADLLLSPSTGLILTTLQQLKQRALPGHPDRSPIKDRMMELQLRYERLVVVISEGLKEHGSDRPVDPRDQEAIAEYERFTTQIGGEVLLRYVPGGEQALVRSIVVEMVNFGLPHGSKDIGDIKLLTDQTTWEIFLCRAGFNTFAAQVILALLKDPVDWPLPSHQVSEVLSTCGLQTFLLMSAEQRVQNFQAILGGSRILKSVNALLDQEWISAVHGFRM